MKKQVWILSRILMYAKDEKDKDIPPYDPVIDVFEEFGALKARAESEVGLKLNWEENNVIAGGYFNYEFTNMWMDHKTYWARLVISQRLISGSGYLPGFVDL